MKRVLFWLAVIVLAGFVAWMLFNGAVLSGKMGTEREAGTPQAAPVEAAQIIARQTADTQMAASGKGQILFGDLHVHSTYSTDAFLWAMPLNQGQGVHPVADACDYARYCSAIDFWSITDHAEASTPLRWKRTKDAIRKCQAGTDPSNPDLVSMLGFEWTQVGPLPDEHFGHKNVIFENLGDNEVAARPIAAQGTATTVLREEMQGFPAVASLLDWSGRQAQWDFNTFLNNIQDVPACPADVPSKDLPVDCYESAKYPEDLLERLENQGLDALVIPHGSSWGFYTPQGTTWDKQLKPRHRPSDFSLIEVYSGHGNSEEFRPYVNAIVSQDGLNAACPPITDEFTPPCQRVGAIIEQRCFAAGLDASECTGRAEQARIGAANMGVAFHMGIPGLDPADMLDAGQCNDCFSPSFNHRPGTSVQYGLAKTGFNPDGTMTRFNWGFIASSDNHRARPGTGYKETARLLTTESGGIRHPKFRSFFQAPMRDPIPEFEFTPREKILENASFEMTEFERQSSFWQTGGLAAVHTNGRSRAEIWDALKRRETYGTSGPRMLLWFNRAGTDGSTTPMGGAVSSGEAGTFTVRAAGSFKQKPGCPDYAVAAMGQARIQSLCSGECYNPTDERHALTRIEIIRIRPQTRADEPVASLIDDPFLVHQCPAGNDGLCEFSFTDDSFADSARDTLYYARAVQEARPTINGDALRCERDEEGNCIKANLCFGDYRSAADDDCLTPSEPRAWSSPIYVNYLAAAPQQ